jgi:hypothetical protein
MPEPGSEIAPISCIQADQSSQVDRTLGDICHQNPGIRPGPDASVLMLSGPHPWYCSTFKPAFQSVTYISPSVVT